MANCAVWSSQTAQFANRKLHNFATQKSTFLEPPSVRTWFLWGKTQAQPDGGSKKRFFLNFKLCNLGAPKNTNLALSGGRTTPRPCRPACHKTHGPANGGSSGPVGPGPAWENLAWELVGPGRPKKPSQDGLLTAVGLPRPSKWSAFWRGSAAPLHRVSARPQQV